MHYAQCNHDTKLHKSTPYSTIIVQTIILMTEIAIGMRTMKAHLLKLDYRCLLVPTCDTQQHNRSHKLLPQAQST